MDCLKIMNFTFYLFIYLFFWHLFICKVYNYLNVKLINLKKNGKLMDVIFKRFI